jgi:hypothetical protein
MSVISNYLADLALNLSLRGSEWTAIATVYVALYTSNPGKADTGTELSSAGGTAYLRQSVAFGAPSTVSAIETVSNNADVTFPIATTDWGAITHIGIKNAADSSAGNLLWYGELTVSKTINTGDRLKFLSGDLIVNLE